MSDNLKKPLVVQKYGGSSLASSEHIKRVAENISARKEQGVNMIVVVSAMGETTDHFVKLAHEVNSNPSPREMDMLLSVGERVSISLVTMAINAIGRYRAVSYTGSQVGIITDDNHTDARILEVKGLRIREALAEDKIVVVAGFQGVSIHKEITTLGRGGSDTTAVALAASLGAEVCEIMSDVDGIYTADPRMIPAAKRIDNIHFDEALEMAASGAGVLQRTSVEYAKTHKVKLSLGSSFSSTIGTILTDQSLAKGCVTSIVHDSDLFALQLSNADVVFVVDWLSEMKIRPKFWQACNDGLILALSGSDYHRHVDALTQLFHTTSYNEKLAVVTVIGSGVSIGSSISNQVTRLIRDKRWQCHGIQNGELALKYLVPKSRIADWLNNLHRTFFEAENVSQ